MQGKEIVLVSAPPPVVVRRGGAPTFRKERENAARIVHMFMHHPRQTPPASAQGWSVGRFWTIPQSALSRAARVEDTGKRRTKEAMRRRERVRIERKGKKTKRLYPIFGASASKNCPPRRGPSLGGAEWRGLSTRPSRKARGSVEESYHSYFRSHGCFPTVCFGIVQRNVLPFPSSL